ncbi:MAG: hypothetical protein R3Y21_04435 [Mycoplasmatota bacterium]
MKQELKFIFLAVIALIGSYAIYELTYEEQNIYTNDEITFSNEYSDANIMDNNNVIYTSYEEVFELLESDESFILYLGSPECPWCRKALPIFVEALNDYNGESFYYMDIMSDRDTLVLTDGNIVTEKEGTDDYHLLVEYLYDLLPTYSGLEDDSIKRIYLPTFVFVSNGEITIHQSTVDSDESSQDALSEEQITELKNIFYDHFDIVFPNMCDEGC